MVLLVRPWLSTLPKEVSANKQYQFPGSYNIPCSFLNDRSACVLQWIIFCSAPGAVASFESHPLGSSAFLLKWQKPLQTNGVLTGYRIYYQTVTGTKVGPLIERKPITDARQMHAKLAGLDPNTKYRIHIKATTRAGEGNGYLIAFFWQRFFSSGFIQVLCGNHYYGCR
jgi:Fibronectin type III domain